MKKISQFVEPFSLQEELASQLKIENVNLLFFSPLFKGADLVFSLFCVGIYRPAAFIN